jgi:hydroxypyruvate isomerase
MKGYSACVEMLFREADFAGRARLAREAGYKAVELWRWHDKDMSGILETGLPVAAALVDSADEKSRDAFPRLGMLARESRALFPEMVEESCEAISAIGGRLLIVAPGQALSSLSRGAQEDNIVECLLAARPALEKWNMELAIEPLNPIVDHVGCYLSSSAQAFQIARAAGAGRIGVLFDIYHQQVSEGNLIANIRANIGLIKHFHVADVPGRHEPGTGEINYKNVIAAIRGAGYGGHVGCEFAPTVPSAEASQYILSL